jgi:hypothetical protein
MASLPLHHFEKIDGLYSSLCRMGDFETCADPRGYVRLSNRLFDACVDAGMPFETDDHVLWAAEAVFGSLVSA